MTDDEMAVLWWSALDESQRARALALADTADPKAAWAFWVQSGPQGTVRDQIINGIRSLQ